MSTDTPICGCIEILSGQYVPRCDCGNSGDLMTATMWCAEKNDEPMKDAIRRENARLREELADRSSIRCANCHINPDMECEPLKQCRGELAEAKRDVELAELVIQQKQEQIAGYRVESKFEAL